MLEAAFCIEALEKALPCYGCTEIFNTDQGSQFTSTAFTEVLLKQEIAISMDEGGLARQRVCRASVAQHQIRGGVSESLRQGRRSTCLDRPVSGFLQWAEASLRP